MTTTRPRVLYLDYLRILSTLAVVLLHVAAVNFRQVDVTSYAWQVFNVFDSAVRWAVPVFVMISGALFLNNDKPLPLRPLYTRTILRMVTAFLFWSAVYAADVWLQGGDMKETVAAFVEGNHHMWYLYMVVGLYVVAPLLRRITADKKMTEYFLLAGVVFTFLIPCALQFLKAVDLPYTTTVVNSLDAAFADMEFHLTLGYPFYFVLGYYLATYDVPLLWRRIGYGLGVVGFLITAVMTALFSRRAGEANIVFYSNFSVNVLMMALGVFLFGKHVLSRITLSEKGTPRLLRLSALTFGVYLVHPLLIDLCSRWLGLSTLSFDPVLAVLVITVLVTVVAFALSALLHYVPFLKRYVV